MTKGGHREAPALVVPAVVSAVVSQTVRPGG